MIGLGMKKIQYETEKEQKYKLYHQVKLINMNI